LPLQVAYPAFTLTHRLAHAWKGTKLEFDEKDDFGFKTPSLEGIAIALHQLTFRQLKMNKTQ
jgi:hypothetical protein